MIQWKMACRQADTHMTIHVHTHVHTHSTSINSALGTQQTHHIVGAHTDANSKLMRQQAHSLGTLEQSK